MPEIMNYDPNLTCSGNMASQAVRLTFGLWQYRVQVEVTIGGNCTGLDVISAAVGAVYEKLERRNVYGCNEDYAELVMASPESPSDVLLCADDDPDGPHGEDWLASMLIGAEIVSITPKQ
ncbi:DUF5406 family protein [Pseudomonas putida]|uniref:DUF5406 family protein n=1 Tax=Pseudomonas putida TaxID=303 RepID=UPI00370A107F